MSASASPAIRHTTTAAAAAVGLIAAVVSYSHMQQLGNHHGEEWRSYLIPISIDGLMAAASMVLLTASPWFAGKPAAGNRQEPRASIGRRDDRIRTCDPLTPRDWQRSRVRFPAPVDDGCRVWHRLAGGARLLYFSSCICEDDQVRSGLIILCRWWGMSPLKSHAGQTSSPSMCPSYHACTAAWRIEPDDNGSRAPGGRPAT
jgi:hypothetical protein